MDDQANRLYAIDLLNRVAPGHFDYEDVAMIARLIPLIEADLATWLEDQLRGTVSRTLIVAAIRKAAHRTPADQHPETVGNTAKPGGLYVVGEKGLPA